MCSPSSSANNHFSSLLLPKSLSPPFMITLPLLISLPTPIIITSLISSPFSESHTIIFFNKPSFYLTAKKEITNYFKKEQIHEMHTLHTLAWKINNMMDTSTQNLYSTLSRLSFPPTLLHSGYPTFVPSTFSLSHCFFLFF